MRHYEVINPPSTGDPGVAEACITAFQHGCYGAVVDSVKATFSPGSGNKCILCLDMYFTHPDVMVEPLSTTMELGQNASRAEIVRQLMSPTGLRNRLFSCLLGAGTSIWESAIWI